LKSSFNTAVRTFIDRQTHKKKGPRCVDETTEISWLIGAATTALPLSARAQQLTLRCSDFFILARRITPIPQRRSESGFGNLVCNYLVAVSGR
jgi:hypothetical protein